MVSTAGPWPPDHSTDPLIHSGKGQRNLATHSLYTFSLSTSMLNPGLNFNSLHCNCVSHTLRLNLRNSSLAPLETRKNHKASSVKTYPVGLNHTYQLPKSHSTTRTES